MRVPTPSPPSSPQGKSLSQTLRKLKLLQTIWRLSFSRWPILRSGSYWDFDVALRSYFLSPASETQLTTPDKVHETTRDLKVSKASGPNGILNRALKHLPRRAVSLLARIFNTVLRAHHFLQTWKHTRLISILKPGKDPAQPSSHRPISLLHTIGKLFEEILLARILHEVNERGLMRDEKFGFRPRHSTSLH